MSGLIFAVVLLMAAAVQARLPSLWWLGGLRVELLPALVAAAALTLPRTSALGLALFAGLAQDALSAMPFGLTALAYGVAACALSASRATLDRELPWVSMGAGALTSLVASVVAGGAQGSFRSGLAKAVVLAALAALVTPLVVLALDGVREWMRGDDH